MSLLAVLCLLPVLAAGDPNFDFVKAQIKAGKVDKDKWIGHRDSGREYRTVTDTGVLVGFELGVTERFDNRWIIAIRPLYRTPDGVFGGETFGSFDPKDHTDGAIKKHGIRKVELIAKPGYAVSAVHMMNSIGFIHFSVTYAKATETGLDPTDTYESEEVGRSKEGQAFVGTTRTNGKFGVGMLGWEHNRIVFAMNLLHCKEGGLTTVGSERPPLPNRNPEPVKPAPRSADPMPRAELPEFKPADLPPPKPEPEPKPEPKAELPAPKAPEPPKKQPEVPAAVASPFTVTPPDEIKPTVFAKKPTEPEKAAASSVPSWFVPAGVGVVVTAVVVGFMLLMNRGKSAQKSRRKAPPVARAAPAERLPRARRVD